MFIHNNLFFLIYVNRIPWKTVLILCEWIILVNKVSMGPNYNNELFFSICWDLQPLM